MNEHTESGFKLYLVQLHITPKHIIKTPLNTPIK